MSKMRPQPPTEGGKVTCLMELPCQKSTKNSVPHWLLPDAKPRQLSDSSSSLTRGLYRVTVLTARHCSDALFRYFSKNVYWLWLDVREPRKVPRTVPGGCPGGAVGGTVSMVCRCARSPVPHAIVTLKMTVADFLKTVRLRTPPHRDGPQRRR